MHATAGPPAPRTAAGLARACLAVTAVLLVGACSAIGEVRRPPPTPGPVETAGPVPSVRSTASWVLQGRPGTVEVRAAAVPVPGDFARQIVEFRNADHGWALFQRCGTASGSVEDRSTCTAILVGTADGGRTWKERPHPRPVAANHQLYLGDDGTLLLLAEPHGWYVAGPRDRSFTQLPYRPEPPAAYRQLLGRFQLCCDDGADQRVVDWAGGQPRPLPGQPELPGQLTDVVAGRAGELWVAAVHDGRPYTAVAADDGRSWRAVGVPAAAASLAVARLATSADKADLWLLGSSPDQGLLASWRLGADGWRRLPAVGQPTGLTAGAPVGAGLLAVAGPAGGGLVGEQYTPTDWPLRGDGLRLLPDGTLLVRNSTDGTVWLGRGSGVDRRWIQLVLRQT